MRRFGPLLLGPMLGVPMSCDNEVYCDTIAFMDTNNYHYEGSIQIPEYTTVSGDIQICWDTAVQDIQCHDMDPAEDIDLVSVIRFLHLSHDDIEAGLSNDDLQQADISGYVQWESDGSTCVDLSSLSLFGTPFDVGEEYNEEGGSFLLLLGSGTTVGVGTRLLGLLSPSSESDNTRVDIPSGCGALDFNADLQSLETIPICSEGPWNLDWTMVNTDGLGNDLASENIDNLLLGFYEGMTAEDLQDHFLDLELMATHLWELDLEGGTSADLSQATDGESTFSGFEGDGVWVLALRCTRCSNPAPLFLTVLEPA